MPDTAPLPSSHFTADVLPVVFHSHTTERVRVLTVTRDSAVRLLGKLPPLDDLRAMLARNPDDPNDEEDETAEDWLSHELYHWANDDRDGDWTPCTGSEVILDLVALIYLVKGSVEAATALLRNERSLTVVVGDDGLMHVAMLTDVGYAKLCDDLDQGVVRAEHHAPHLPPLH